ncbi:hypothetical protein FPV67DRAFT_3831 [Lyophyllum atratum]|nr:hypothetical protein FPV67DRAFT_3831 [Lyophyllum atratum]
MVLRLLLHFYFFLQWVQVDAVATNRTIDDTLGDSATGAKPIYLPSGNWDGPSCDSHCTIRPSSDRAFDNTYSAATYVPGGGARTAQFSFKGTDIYIFFILANNVPNAFTETFCNFVLDGQNSGSFHHAPSQSTAYQYNALVYSKQNLPNTDHTLLITADGYNTLSYVNFDYAIYTSDDGSSPPPDPPPPSPSTSNPNSPQSPTTTVTQQPPPGVVNPPRTVTTVISGSTVVTQVTDTPNPNSLSNPSSTTGSGSTAATNGDGENGVSAHKTPIGAIVGGTLGGLLLLLLLLALLILCRRRRRNMMDSSAAPLQGNPVLTPFTSALPASQTQPETRTIPHEANPFFTPERKRREPAHSPMASMSSSVEALRAQRQSEISHQISGLSGEMSNTSRSTRSGSSSRWDGSQVSRIMEQNVAMKAQIEQLQSQLHSDWALGLSNEPPPGYTRRESNSPALAQ